VPLRRVDTHLTQHGFERQRDELLGLAHDVGPGGLRHQDLEDPATLRRFLQVGPGELALGHREKSSPGLRSGLSIQ